MKTIAATAELLSAGGNRHPSAADWDPGTGLLAYGTSCNIALWAPENATRQGITRLITVGESAVNAVKFWRAREGAPPAILAGSTDGHVHLVPLQGAVTQLHQPEGQAIKSINAFAVCPASAIFASGSASGILTVWDGATTPPTPLSSITLRPQFIPLTMDLAYIPDKGHVLAVGGTRNFVQIYTTDSLSNPFVLAASLTGHEGWIRSVAFNPDSDTPDGDLLLASASQDKYIRLWRLHQGEQLPPQSQATNDPLLGSTAQLLANKAHRFTLSTTPHSITFEALLLGHEDWIFTTQWHRAGGKNRLLSASADNSLSIWELDPTSGLWVSTVRLGEISQQKGATTATGSAGGFWIGLWSGDGNAVVSLGRTGSWRVWRHDAGSDVWVQGVGVTGHTRAVQDLAWSTDASYLLTTAQDQTTRLFAAWSRAAKPATWHELSRAQIHGYDLNCVASISPTRFISGADEKLLRVFDQPDAVAALLAALTGVAAAPPTSLPGVASIPVLGLSNKSIEPEVPADDDAQDTAQDASEIPLPAATDTTSPPTEDALARHLLWPEHEKLYGHGYEISAVAASHDGTLVATACRATALDHAVIRLFDAHTWRPVDPPLRAHSLTITRLAFSPDDRFLLSVSRDRACFVFSREKEWGVLAEMARAHTRMVLDCAWAADRAFVTASRDKTVGFFRLDGENIEKVGQITQDVPVTAVHAVDEIVAFGLETGAVRITRLEKGLPREVSGVKEDLYPAKTVTRLQWKEGGFLAVASDDGSVRVLKVDLENV